MRRKITGSEAEFLEAGTEPDTIIATGYVGSEGRKAEELHVYFLGDSTTLVAEHGQRVGGHWAFDEIMEPAEVFAEWQSRRAMDEPQVGDSDAASERLRNAAPDLLAALSAVLEASPAFRLKKIGYEGSEARIRQEAQIAAEDQARAAIAKAIGG